MNLHPPLNTRDLAQNKVGDSMKTEDYIEGSITMSREITTLK